MIQILAIVLLTLYAFVTTLCVFERSIDTNRVVVESYHFLNTYQQASQSQNARRLAQIDEGSANQPSSDFLCQKSAPVQAANSTPVNPVWVASFPGSGSELFRNLVEKSTGLASDEVYQRDTNCEHNPVICKTHFPLRIGGDKGIWGLPPQKRQDTFGKEAIVLLRNPSTAISSHFNYKWEKKHGVESHSQQGSETEWIEWRDRRFSDQIQAWKQLLDVWQRGPYKVALFVSYEQLTDEKAGASILHEVTQLLQRNTPGMNLHENLSCLWNQLVRSKPSKKRKGQQYKPAYTVEQRDKMVEVIDQVLAKHGPSSSALTDTLTEYRNDMFHNLRLEESVFRTT